MDISVWFWDGERDVQGWSPRQNGACLGRAGTQREPRGALNIFCGSQGAHLRTWSVFHFGHITQIAL